MNLTNVQLEEYRALKAEQAGRIHTRDNLIYVTLFVAGVTGYAAITTHLYGLLLAGAAGTLMLGWHYLGGDRAIIGIRRYLHGSLGPLVADELGEPLALVFAWESIHRQRRAATFYRLGGLLFALVLFVGPTVGVVPWWLTHQWDGTAGDPLLWTCPLLALGAAAVTVAALGSTINRHPADKTQPAGR